MNIQIPDTPLIEQPILEPIEIDTTIYPIIEPHPPLLFINDIYEFNNDYG